MTKINQKRQNNSFAGAALHYSTRADDMAAYDSLPGELQRAIDENATKLSAETVVMFAMSILRQSGSAETAVATTRRKIRQIEQGEIEVFASRHKATHRYELPHVAAQATVQRYGAAGPSRHPPRRYGRMPRIRGFGLLDVPEAA